jgi:hypothetical protein
VSAAVSGETVPVLVGDEDPDFRVFVRASITNYSSNKDLLDLRPDPGMSLAPQSSWASGKKGERRELESSRGGQKRRPLRDVTTSQSVKQRREPTGLRGVGIELGADVEGVGVLESGVETTGLVAGGGGAGGGVWGGGMDVDVDVNAWGGGLVADPGALGGGGGAPAATEHALTTWTRDSPFAPVTGVKVKVHVSVTGPAALQFTSEGFQKMVMPRTSE